MAAAHSSVALRIPWVKEPGWLQSIGLKELDMTEAIHTYTSFWVLVSHAYFSWFLIQRLFVLSQKVAALNCTDALLIC